MADGRYVPGGRVRIALLAAALVLGWIALRAATQNSLDDDAPETAAQLWPADGPSLAGLARQRLAAASGVVDDSTRALYRSALEREPLLADPLAIAAIDAAASGDSGRAERLMEAARDRDPRFPLPRFWLFDHYVRAGQYPLALKEVGPAIRLQPEALAAVMTVLAGISGTPEGRAALTDKLATQPFWRTAFFQTAAANTSPETMLGLLSSLPDPANASQEQRSVYLSLINSGQGVRAFETWRQLLPAPYRPRADGIYDGNFARWPGAEPFNWMLTDNDIGTTRTITAGDLPQSTALDVRYFGSIAGTLAEQYVRATPGPYLLQLAARRQTAGATGGDLSLVVRCMNGASLATLPLEPLGAQLRAFSMPLVVPGDCDLLRVQVVGTPGELFSEVEAQITGVTLAHGG